MISDPPFKNKIDELKKNEQITVFYRKTNITKTPPYITLGSGLKTKKFDKKDIVDALKVFSDLNPSQQKIVLYFKDQIIQTRANAHYAKQTLENPNLVTLSKSKNDLEAKEIRRLLRQNSNGKALADKVLRKFNNTEFMLNPFMFIPNDNFDQVAAIWKDLVKESKQESVSED